MKAADWCKVITLQLNPQDFLGTYQLVDACLRADPPDLILITGDRVEMCAAAAAAFHNKVPIAHYYAGIINLPVTTFDDIDRHAITLWSSIQFCEDDASRGAVQDLMLSVGLKANAYTVGISHLDDLEIDESKVPYAMENGTPLDIVEPYDLFLVNAEPLSEKDFGGPDAERLTIHIGGNPDGDISKIGSPQYPNLPRPQFLGLLKHCRRFITNSSAAIYEAPQFLKPEQIVMVGDRNLNRPRGPFETGASDRIVAILKEYLK